MISPLIMSVREAGSTKGDIMFIAKILVCSVLTGDCIAIQDITGISISRKCAPDVIEMFKDVNGDTCRSWCWPKPIARNLPSPCIG